MNTATIVGRAGQDAEIRYFESGKVKTTFSLAVNRWDAKSKEEVTDWFNIETWDKTAEFACEYIKKGTLMWLEGRLAVNKYSGKDGQEKDYYWINATQIKLLGKKSEN